MGGEQDGALGDWWGEGGQMETAGWHMDTVCRKLAEGEAREGGKRTGGGGYRTSAAGRQKILVQ